MRISEPAHRECDGVHCPFDSTLPIEEGACAKQASVGLPMALAAHRDHRRESHGDSLPNLTRVAERLKSLRVVCRIRRFHDVDFPSHGALVVPRATTPDRLILPTIPLRTDQPFSWVTTVIR